MNDPRAMYLTKPEESLRGDVAILQAFFDIAIAQGILQVSPDRAQNDLDREMAPFG